MASNMRAFPTYAHPDSQAGAECSGMTLRDWFAGQALCGFTSFSLDDGEPFMGAADTAKAAYNYADAMLAERERVQ